jgi:hypothetical protein
MSHLIHIFAIFVAKTRARGIARVLDCTRVGTLFFRLCAGI